MYEMLIGKAPFASPEYINDSRLAKRIIESNILNHKVSFPVSINTEAKDLIRRLLNPEPKQRPNIKEVLSHPFLKEEKQIQKEGLIKSMRNMNMNKLQHMNQTMQDTQSVAYLQRKVNQ